MVDRDLLEGASEGVAEKQVDGIGRGLVVSPSFSFSLVEVLIKYLATRMAQWHLQNKW